MQATEKFTFLKRKDSGKKEKASQSLETLKAELEQQEALIIEHQVVINTMKRQLEDKRIYLEDLIQKSSSLKKDNLEQENRFQKFMEENENLIKNFEYYKKFFKEQIEELEAQLVKEKMELADEANIIEETKIKIIESKRALNQNLKDSYLKSSFISTSDSTSHEASAQGDRELSTLKRVKGRTNSVGSPVRNLLLSEEKSILRKNSWDVAETVVDDFESEVKLSCRMKLNFEAFDPHASPEGESVKDTTKLEEEPFAKKLSPESIADVSAKVQESSKGSPEEGRMKSRSVGKIQTPEKEMPFNIHKKQRDKAVNVVMLSLSRSPSTIFSSPQDLEYLKEKDDNNKVDLKFWVNEIMVLFEKKGKNLTEKLKIKLKDAIKKFIPSKFRTNVWPKLVGNKQRICKAYFNQITKDLSDFPIASDIKKLICEDVKRAYPNLQLFQCNDTYSQDLQLILELFQFTRPEIGYVQGMAYPAAIFLFHLNKYQAFKYLSNFLLTSDFFLSLYKFKTQKIDAYLNTFDYFLKDKHPAISKHLCSKKITKEMYLFEWFYSIFSRAFHLRVVSKIWDLILYYGDVMIFKTALGILSTLEDKLLKSDFEESLILIRNCTQKIDEKELFKKILGYNFSTEKLIQRFEKELEMIESGINQY